MGVESGLPATIGGAADVTPGCRVGGQSRHIPVPSGLRQGGAEVVVEATFLLRAAGANWRANLRARRQKV